MPRELSASTVIMPLRFVLATPVLSCVPKHIVYEGQLCTHPGFPLAEHDKDQMLPNPVVV